MGLVAGVDSSTQSVKVVVLDADTGALVRQARAAHPDGTEIDPALWWSALDSVLGGLLDGVQAIAIAGQQHGMVVLDEADRVIRPALLWNDTRSAPDAQALIDELGGAQAWADAVGSVPVASLTVAKIRWLARAEPRLAARVARLMLPHDYLTWRLAGAHGEATTDRGDASGTGYWSPGTGRYRDDLVELALGHVPALPRVAAPAEPVGTTPGGVLLAPGTGDNMAAALALDLQPGDVVISLGTSGTAYARADHPAADGSGLVAGFADATGAFLPLACTLNAARVLSAAARLIGADLDELGRLAMQAPPGSRGLTLIPYLDGERTPNLPDARGSLMGISRENLTRENLARSAVEGMLLGLAGAVDALRDAGVVPLRVLLIGGAAANEAVAQIARTIFRVPVHVPAVREHVAEGAARQAAWALSGSAALPAWSARAAKASRVLEPIDDARAREQYAAATAQVHGLPR